jgi:hypothetical protein
MAKRKFYRQNDQGARFRHLFYWLGSTGKILKLVKKTMMQKIQKQQFVLNMKMK